MNELMEIRFTDDESALIDTAIQLDESQYMIVCKSGDKFKLVGILATEVFAKVLVESLQDITDECGGMFEDENGNLLNDVEFLYCEVSYQSVIKERDDQGLH